MFDWLVERVNESLATDEIISQARSFIGVLDIYGFEHFKKVRHPYMRVDLRSYAI